MVKSEQVKGDDANDSKDDEVTMESAETFYSIKLREQALRANAKRGGSNRLTGMGHPATSDPEYTKADLEFMEAMREYQHRTGKKFPTMRETLRVLVSIGYSR